MAANILKDLLRRGDAAGATDIVVHPESDGIQVWFRIHGDYTHDKTLEWEEYASVAVGLTPFLVKSQPVTDAQDDVAGSTLGGPLHARAMIRPSPLGDIFTIRIMPSEASKIEEPKRGASVEEKLPVDELLVQYDFVVTAMGAERVPWDAAAVRSSLMDAATDGMVGMEAFARLIDQGVLQRTLEGGERNGF